MVALSGSLEILRAKFGDTPVLGVDQIAECLNVSRGHIYNLVSQERLPFPLLRFSDKIQVSMAAFARYLDGDEEPPKVPEVVRPEMAIKRKPGRPRGSASISKLQLAFQSELKLAVVRVEVELAFAQLAEDVSALQYKDDKASCAGKFEEVKGEALHFAKQAQISLEKSITGLVLPSAAAKKKSSRI